MSKLIYFLEDKAELEIVLLVLLTTQQNQMRT